MKVRLSNMIQAAVGGCAKNWADIIATHLLSEGVIVPPCKVGDKTFLLLEKMRGGYDILESKCVAISENIFLKVYSMFIDCAEISNTLEYKLEDFGRWVFLTREEAEKALERSR